MNMPSQRRQFLKQSYLLSGGLLLLGRAAATRATGQTVKPAPQAAPLENDTLRTIHELRTIHGNFDDRPVPESALETILQATTRAANASNNQSYSIVVVKDRQKMKQICGYSGSCLLLYCADSNRMEACAEAMGYHYDPGTIESFVTAAMNTMLAAQTAVVAAKSIGIDSLLTNGVHRGDMDRLWKLLDLPQTHCFPLIALILGYPTQEPGYLKGRLTGPGILHNEKYHRLTPEETAEIIRKYDDKQQHLGLTDDWDTRGFKHYLDWYFKEWVGRANGQESQMLRILKRCGFVEQATS
jgi:nitroreductase